MDKLIVLGTGNAMVTKCYNTCFALQRGSEYVLVDAGGGNGIMAQLTKAGVPNTAIRPLNVTHADCDHLLGVVWMVRKIGDLMMAGKYQGQLHVWCHASIIEAIRIMSELSLQKKHVKMLGEHIVLHPITEGTETEMLGCQVRFFDILSSKLLQYGFTVSREGWKLTCLGDEPYNPLCEKVVRGSDWLLAEAFCLYGHRDIFKPYEKHHSTVMDAAKLAQELHVPNLVLWHTEDTYYENRKELYTAEGKEYYTGNLFVPYDLETIDL